VIEPLSGPATLKGSKGLIAAVQTCHAQRWQFEAEEFVVGVGVQTSERDGQRDATVAEMSCSLRRWLGRAARQFAHRGGNDRGIRMSSQSSLLEALAVLSSLVYVVLAVPRSRWCWLAGGVGSLIYIWLFARARLPMQSLLQVWYVGVAVFGFMRWSHEGTTRISLLPWRGHVGGIAASLLLAVAIARFLAAETQAAWPHLDASTMVLSLFATWLTARGKLENWLYWIIIDAVQAWLYAAQGLVFTAFLFLVYLVIASVGFIEWLKTYRRQTSG
jgi:nicotinamide mononucleotide transporter